MGVWANPMSDAKRGTDHVVSAEKSMTDVGALPRSPLFAAYHHPQATWTTAIHTAWQLDPAIAVFLTERCKYPVIQNEVGRLVRSNTRDVLDVPEALRFLLGDISARRDLKVNSIAVSLISYGG